MKISISNIAWEKKDDEKIYRYLKKKGIDGIEIAPTRIFSQDPYIYLNEVKDYSIKLKENYGLNIVSMQSVWYGFFKSIFASETEREDCLAYWTKATDFANAIDCRNIVFGNPRQRMVPIDENGKKLLTETEVKAISKEFFKKLSNISGRNGACTSIEPNPIIYNTNFINTTMQAIELVSEVANEAFRLNLDLGTIINNNENLIEIVKELNSYDECNPLNLVNHIHISEPYLVRIEKRALHKQLAYLLREYSYNKYVSIEMGAQENLDIIFETIDYVYDLFQ